MPLHVRCILCLNQDIGKAISSYLHLPQILAEASKAEIETQKSEIEDKILAEQQYDINSTILGKNIMEDMQLLGQAMVAHMNLIHPKELARVALLAVHWNGFNVMKFFEASNESHIFEKEKEQMRDKLVEEVMMFSPEEDEDEFEDEDDDLDEDEDNDLTRGDDEDEEEEDEDETVGSAKKE